MKRELKITSDGSPTVYSERWDQHYHSVHGAFNESMHVFISNGLELVDANPIRILEFGMGTGINVFLTWRETRNSFSDIYFDTIEAYPLEREIWSKLRVGEDREQETFSRIHELEWESTHELDTNFFLRKFETDILKWRGSPNTYDLIYFDAFAPNTQSELWTESVFRMCFDVLKPGGSLVTYCAKGDVKRNMKAAGFEVIALPGPPRKREMTKAVKRREV